MFFKDKVKCSIKSMASINITFSDATMYLLAMLNRLLLSAEWRH